MRNFLKSLRSSFQKADTPPSLTAREAIGIFCGDLGLKPRNDGLMLLHDLVHVLAGATSGSLADERRAAHAESMLFSYPVFCCSLAGDRLVRIPDIMPLSTSQIASSYVAAGRAHLETGKIKGRLSQDDSLTREEKTETLARAAFVDTYFRRAHKGRRIEDFTISEIMDMKLSAFGLEAIMQDNRLIFAPLLSIPQAVRLADQHFTLS